MLMPSPAPGYLPRRLLDRRDWLLVLALMAIGARLRWHWFSGLGLGDDAIFRNFIMQIVTTGNLPRDNISYRFTWWLPTALAGRLMGPTEVALVLPITITATLGILAVYAFGKALFGRAGAVIATVLLIVHPLDFAWSTMMANDFMVSLFSALCLLAVVRALESDDLGWRRRLWGGAASCLWLSYHAKVAAVFLLP